MKSHSQDTGILHSNPQVQALSYTHTGVVLRHCDFHPAAAPAASQHSALLSPLSQVHTQVLRTQSRHSREQLALCSAGCPRAAPHNVKPRQPCGRVAPSQTPGQMQQCGRRQLTAPAFQHWERNEAVPTWLLKVTPQQKYT